MTVLTDKRIASVDADIARFDEGLLISDVIDVGAIDFYHAYANRGFLNEHEGRMKIARTSWREIQPAATWRIPSSMRRNLKKENFTFSIDQQFHAVMHECAKPRPSSKERIKWIGRQTKNILSELHEEGDAHTIEIYRGNQLAGGILGLVTGGIFISLSVYGAENAGNAAVTVLETALDAQGFDFIDSIMPSNISRIHGGQMVSYQVHALLHADAIRKKLVFSPIEDKLPVLDYIQPLIEKAHAYGRPFPRQKCDASEEQDRSETVENLRKTRARNRGGGQKRHARPGP
jgi:leucyl/phenylalanyl-tRNA--protein transferase